MKNAPESPSIFLLLKYQHETLRKLEINAEANHISIGRKGFGADIEIASNGVSRLHASIEVIDARNLRLKDEASTNGTYLNGLRVQESSLRTGDVISFQKNKPDFWIIVNALQSDLDITRESTDIKAIEHLADSKETLYEILQSKKQISIGRQNCDITLANLTISRRHTLIYRDDQGAIYAKDLGSKNGTFVNGEQIFSPQRIQEHDRIQVGKYEFKLEANPGTLAEAKSEALVLEADNLFRTIGKGTAKKTILNGISLEAKPGEILAIMGPSGSGKSTLLKALNGDAPANSGKVMVHGRDFYKNYKLLKQDIGYVPQDDIVHKQLSVQDSLYFAARLRLASDVSRAEIEAKIQEILEKLGISHIQHSLIKEISGGQRKRVSIAVELLSDPSILFLDEPTSPLDPETVEEFLKILKRLTESGTCILMVTHKPDDLDSADKVVFLTRGGFLAYFGDISGYMPYFNTKNVIGVYASINDLEKGKDWAEQYRSLGKVKKTKSLGNTKITPPRRQAPLRQYFWLTYRYFRIKTNDRVNTAILVLQAPIIALFLAVLFEKMMLQTLFLMIIASIWLGTSNAAREIIAELPIYRRERMFNLRILPYLFSKLTVINFFALIQVLLLVGIVKVSISLPHYGQTVALLFGLSFLGCLLGLFLSSVFDNADKVMSLVPLVLLPQIMLAGVIQRLNEQSEWLSFLTISRWGMELSANLEEKAFFYYPEKIPNSEYYEALRDIPPLDSLRRAEVEDSLNMGNVPDTLHLYVEENILRNSNMLEFPQYFSPENSLLFLSLHGLVLFLAIYWALRRKDRL